MIRGGTILRSLACAAGVGLLFDARAMAAPPSETTGATEPAIENTRVLTRVVPADPQITARLHAELGVSGLDGETIEISNDVPVLGVDLLDRVSSANASAAIEIVVARTRIDVWVADANTGKTLNRRFDLNLDSGLAEPRAIAIAAVELLRTSRLELADVVGEDPPPEDEGGELPTIEQATEDERPPEENDEDFELPLAGTLSLAPVIGGGPGELGLTTHLEVAGRWVPKKRFALRASIWIPTLGNNVVDELGEARVLTLLAFIEPQLRLPGGAPWFHPELGLGVGAAVTVIQGQPSPGKNVDNPVLPGIAAHTHLGLGFQVSRRVWFRIDGYVGIVQPRPRVVFIETVVATWGLPFANGALGVEVWF